MHLGVDTLPVLLKDAGDRNRTSPFAFTGNKFEYRAVASNQSIAAPLTALNTIMAESLDYIATKLEKAKGRKFEGAVADVLTEIARADSAIIFNGNNYAEEWHAEAKKRGLPNLVTTVDAVPVIAAKSTVAAYSKFGVLSKRELEARHDIMLEQYVKSVNVEANIVVEMVHTKYLPAAIRYQTELATNAAALKAAGLKADLALLEKVGGLIAALQVELAKLETLRSHHVSGLAAEAAHFCHHVLPQLLATRKVVDALEAIVADDNWPVPTYEEILFIN
jgi:glutamine synthetase